MNEMELIKKSRKFDSSLNKKDALDSFVRMYNEYKNDENSIQLLNQGIRYFSDEYSRRELRNSNDKLEVVKDFVLIEKLFWMIMVLYERGIVKDVRSITSYVSIITYLSKNELLGLLIEYTTRGKKHLSAREIDLMSYEDVSIDKFRWIETWNIENIRDLVPMVKAKLSYAYYAIIETPEQKEVINKRTIEYASLVEELLDEKYQGKPIKSLMASDGDKMSLLQYQEIYSVLYSPESLFVLMNNYRLASDANKKDAKTLLLKAADLQCRFIFENKLFFYSQELEQIEYCNNIFCVLDNYLSSANSMREKYKIIPAMPFYNLSYFASRIGRDSIADANLIVFIDQMNDEVLYFKASLMYDFFVDEVLSSAEESLYLNGESINSEYDLDVYHGIQQILSVPYPDNAIQFMDDYDENEKVRYEYIGDILRYYLLGIYLRTLYLLADCVEGKDDTYPFRIYRDKIQNILYGEKTYGKASNMFSKYSVSNIALVEEKAYSNIKTEIIMNLDNALDTVDSYDELLNADLKTIYSKYLLYLGSDDYFLSLADEICQKISKLLELHVKLEPQYKSLFDEMIKKYTQRMDIVENSVKNYLQDDYLIIQGKIKKAISSLTTGEFLYNQYVDRDNIPEMDFSCIALEYYTSLELLANIVFYIPYCQKILKPKCDGLVGTNIDEKLKGYIGTSKAAYILDRNHRPKPSLELGTISNLYINLLKKNGTVHSKATEIAKYLDILSLDKSKVCQIFKEIQKVAILRNEAAHGGEILPHEKAKKAQDVTYIHNPNPDPTIDIDAKCTAATCHNLIDEIFELF